MIVKGLRRYQSAALAARDAVWPDLAAAVQADDDTWLDALPHIHPFFEAMVPA
jgi:hypothetical protein